LNIAFVFKTSVGSINSSFTEENISIVKKVTLPNGEEIPYVSAQAMRRYIRDKWQEMGMAISPVHRLTVEAAKEEEEEESLSTSQEAGKERPVARQVMASSECNPGKYVDDDLFGFMFSRRNDIRKRTSPVKVSPAIAFFPYRGDRDLGVRITEEGKKDPTQMMPPFETEVYYNYFFCNILVDLERVGVFKDDSYGKAERPNDLSPTNRRERLKALMEAVRDLWGGGKQARFLTDISPKFIIYSRQSVKKPIFLERVKMKEDETIDMNSVAETLKDERDLLHKVVIGVANGFGGVDVRQSVSYGTQQSESKVTINDISTAFADIIKDATSAIRQS
jgi:CRISPR-associated protein Cst2